MGKNRGTTSLRAKKNSPTPMRDYDRLPPELRAWVATAQLPWRAKSVQSAYAKALARTGDKRRALRELDNIQRRLIQKDVQKVWGAAHPAA